MSAVKLLLLMGGRRRIKWLLRDEFTVDVAAGSVNGSVATPIGSNRVATDASNNLSVTGGQLVNAGGAAGIPAMRYALETRTAGNAILARITPSSGAQSGVYIGYDNDTTISNYQSINFRPSSSLTIGGVVGGTLLAVGAWTSGAQYKIAIVQRANGLLYFIRDGIYSTWTLIYCSKDGSYNPYKVVGALNVSCPFTVDWINGPLSPIAVSPLASDAFTRADGALGTTGGGGAEETGGAGKTWTTKSGTWGVSTNKAVASVAGIATVDTGTVNVIVEAALTRSAGNVGIVLRYADADNYIYAHFDGTNAQLVKVVAGTPTAAIVAAVTYGDGKRLIVSADLTKFRMYYGDLLVGTEQTIADASLQTGTAHGIYTSDASNSLDNFVVWARGTGGEYESTFNKYINP